MECTNAERPVELKCGGKEGYEATNTAVGKKILPSCSYKEACLEEGVSLARP